MSHPRERLCSSPGLRGLAGVLLVLYAAPLFWPPAPLQSSALPTPDVWLLQRIFPGIPPAWVALRVAALAAAALLVTASARLSLRDPFGVQPRTHQATSLRVLRPIALVLAVLHALSSPWAAHLQAGGQIASLALLFVPALLLAASAATPGRWSLSQWTAALPTTALILAWIALRILGDPSSPRLADTVDGWNGFVDLLDFYRDRLSVLTDLFDPKLPGVGGALVFLHGLPLMRLAGVSSPSLQAVQIFQILWIAVTAGGVGLLARTLVGPGLSLVAVSVFLFAPYTRFVAIIPGPFLAGPLYATAIALCAVAAWRRRSEAGVAALGALSGLTLLYPSAVPTAALFVAITLWQLRAEWRRLWIGFAAGFASFLAALVPALPNMLTPDRLLSYHRWDGLIQVIDPNLLGQLSFRAFGPLNPDAGARPADILVAALLSPFAHPRMSVRLLGDCLFDPLGAALIAIGLAAAVKAARGSTAARVLLLFWLAALSPAFVSPVNVVDVVHAAVLPVPAALLAAAGFAALRGCWSQGGGRRWAAAVTAVAVCVGGSLLFDVVNPRILGASSIGILLRALEPQAAPRALLLDYPKDFNPGLRWQFTEQRAASAGPRPVAVLATDARTWPTSDLAAQGKDLLFWSPALDQDLAITRSVCGQWPEATLYAISDPARVGRAYAANLGGIPWEPRLPADEWQSIPCSKWKRPQSGANSAAEGH